MKMKMENEDDGYGYGYDGTCFFFLFFFFACWEDMDMGWTRSIPKDWIYNDRTGLLAG